MKILNSFKTCKYFFVKVIKVFIRQTRPTFKCCIVSLILYVHVKSVADKKIRF